MKKLIIGTRGSDLALWQANHIMKELAAIGLESEIKIIKTQGDKILNLRLDKLEGKGFFTKELEDELMAGTIDIAVHSLKDLPTVNPPGLTIAAIPKREEATEYLLILKDCVDVSKKLSLKKGAMVGTSSNRRKSQLLGLRPDLEIEDLRGNVPTRIAKLRNEDYDAILLAKAGVKRLGLDLSDLHVEELQTTELISAPAQGALGIQIRESDTELFAALQPLNDARTAEEVGVERKVLNLFEGGCHMPLGCYCKKEGADFEVWTAKANDAEDFPKRLFLRAGSSEGLAERIVAAYNADKKRPAKVFISREIGEHSYFRRALAESGIEIEGRSLIRTFPIVNILDPFYLKNIDWIFFSSRNGVEYFFKLNPQLPKKTRFGVVGHGSEDALRQFGHFADFVGESGDVTEVAADFAALVPGQTVLFPRAADSLQTVQKALGADTRIVDLPIYETVTEENIDGSSADVLIFTSPSNVDAYFAGNLLEPGQQVIAIGSSTGRKFEEMGVTYTRPYSPDEIGLAEAVFALEVR
ncbi:hydroxymethylbilane synthase [Pedobacter yulinensis]|uniref:Porphobilinogen deaminase n=1 Tax=Pedobacter yulinensis TaxID=2126353 RepID=A0A2T3HQ92_9SPHI|nr:hydroxymethylbilane synthase [Pedobacter yulinensis]PST84557.1 hydroxymethylbilane synthase [Pedobacter yulinensis]